MRATRLHILSLLLILCGGTPRAGADTLFHYISETGEPIGRGKEATLLPADGYNFQVTGTPRYLDFQVTRSTSASNYEFYFLSFAAQAGSLLTVGDYANATLYQGYYQSSGPGLDFSANAAGSSSVTGRFQVLEATFDDHYNVVSFAANFVQNTNQKSPAVYGEIRYNSSVPYTTPVGVAELAGNKFRVFATSSQQVVNVSRHGSSAGTLSVDYATADGTDLAGRDYSSVVGTLTWADGDTADKSITVPILRSGDPLQGDGTVLLGLSGPGAGTQNQATITILNDSSAVTFVHFQSDPGDRIGKGQERTFNVDGQFIITPSQGYNGTVSFKITSGLDPSDYTAEQHQLDFEPAAGGHLVPGDYQGARGYPFDGNSDGPRLDFDDNAEALTGNFQILEAEYDAQGNVLKFAANFEQHDSYTLAGLFGQIRYNSTVPLPPARGVEVGVVATVADTYDYIDNVPGMFTITRTGSIATPLTVTYELSGSAVAGRDYLPLKGKKTIKAGRSTAQVPVVAVYGGRSDHSTRFSLKLKLTPQDGVYGVAATPRPAKVHITHWGS